MFLFFKSRSHCTYLQDSCTQGYTTFINDISPLLSTFYSSCFDCSTARSRIPSNAYSFLYNFIYSDYSFYLHSVDVYSLYVRDETVSHILINGGINLALIGKSIFVWLLVIFNRYVFDLMKANK